ncbi:MAG: hypothetical protein D6807_04415 [Alphaproteobacteria bacterium]|nr:MAG: hypothetical protein D6807_04415 [Alphaproteobacteria bacterium]
MKTGRELVRVSILAGLLVTLVTAGTVSAGEEKAPTGPDGCVVEQNFYYPKAGKEAEALAVRRKGSAVRRKLGLPVGRIFVLADAYSGHPASGKTGPGHSSHLMSEIVFANEAAAKAAHATLLASPDYLAVRAEMGKLLERFESATWHLADGDCTADGPGAPAQ